MLVQLRLVGQVESLLTAVVARNRRIGGPIGGLLWGPQPTSGRAQALTAVKGQKKEKGGKALDPPLLPKP